MAPTHQRSSNHGPARRYSQSRQQPTNLPAEAGIVSPAPIDYLLADTELEVISKPKRGYERRNVHLTHPVPQALLANEIASNWRCLARWLSNQTYSLDRIRISSRYERGIEGINFHAHRDRKSLIEASSDWLVKTDIARFYPSIYTHSIPWAAYGKSKVKKNLAIFKGSLGDRLDILVRKCNRNQTTGIPIGPESSRIIAEVISSRIDFELKAKGELVDPGAADRLQDDWFVGAKSMNDAEMVLSRLEKAYQSFGLEINGSKTSIQHILANRMPSWLSEMGSYLAQREGELRAGRLHDFLQMSLRLQVDLPSEPIVSYALSVIEAKTFSHDDTARLESFLLKAAVLSPLSMDKVCRIIVNIDRQTGALSKGRLRERLVKLAEVNLDRGYAFEAMWQIYALRGIREPIVSQRVASLIEGHAGSVIPLILLDMKSRNLFPCKLPTTEWERQISEDRVLRDWIWLLAYEGIRKGWLNDRTNVLQGPFLREMNRRHVEFYDPSKNVASNRAVSRRRKARNTKYIREAKEIVEQMRNPGIFSVSSYE